MEDDEKQNNPRDSIKLQDFSKEIIKRKVGGNSSSFQITLPKEWAELYNLKKGDWVMLQGRCILPKKELTKK